ncbi:unannotated protein [freshwater metagenome]|uniref:Unannotated protein n=1 Tax=freshwater metagenome TaxID=449393 RepID=A0A6J7DN01_9ZZZZ
MPDLVQEDPAHVRKQITEMAAEHDHLGVEDIHQVADPDAQPVARMSQRLIGLLVTLLGEADHVSHLA